MLTLLKLKKKIRNALSRVSHTICIETGRYEGMVRENRMCKLRLMNVVESVYQFLIYVKQEKN